MRLFVAIHFSDEVKASLLNAIDALRHMARGNFTRPENLHLTLAFIGESDRVGDIKAVLEGCCGAPFDITVGGFGRFGELYWAGIDQSSELKSLALDIQSGLREAGFDIEKRDFKPHITLARQVESAAPLRLEVPKKTMTVSRVSLMKSERINGRLTYTEVYGRTLK